MKTLGIKTKKIVRKITAIASAALLSGLSMGVAAADLSNLTSTFITNGQFDAYVVLGTHGASNVAGFADDVAGAVVVAAAFAQQAISTTSTSGTAVVERNVTTGYLNGSGYLPFNGVVPSSDWNKVNSDDGFSWLPNSTVQNSTSDVANVTAKLTVKSSAVALGNDGNYTIYSDGKIIYNLTFNSDKGTSGNKGIGMYIKNIPLPDGNKYQITNISQTSTSATPGADELNVTLGSYTEVSATTGKVYQIGDTGATYEILTYATSPSAYLKIKVTGADGTELFNDYVESGKEVYSNDDFALRLTKYYITNGKVDATMAWTTSKLVLRNQKENSKWPDWKIYLTNDTEGNITSIAWVYDPDGSVSSTAGSKLSMLDNFFNVSFGEFTINSTDKVARDITIYGATSTAKDIYFVDNESNTHSINVNVVSGSFSSANVSPLNNWIDGYSFTMTCWEDGSTPKVNISRGSDYTVVTATNGTPFFMNDTNGNVTAYQLWANLTWSGSSACSNDDWNLTVVNFTSNAGNPINDSLYYALTGGNWGNVSETSVNGTVTITEEDGNTIVYIYSEGSLDKLSAVHDDSIDDGATYYTDYGSKISRSGNTVTISYPEAVRHGSVAVGRSGSVEYTLTANEYNEDLDLTLKSASSESVSINKIDVGIAKLDTEVTSTSLTKPVILMGGWAVNSLVQELVDNGLVNKSDLSADKALVQLVDNAFNSQSALVIAGWSGKDTRLAAQVVASQVLGSDMGLTGSKAILNTAGSTVADVTVI